ncbi:MAG: transposase [Clostridia bacterium]
MFKFLTYTYRIYPDKIQTEKIENNFVCSRFIFNKLLEYKITVYKEYKKYKKKCEKNNIVVDREKFNKKYEIPSVSEIKKIYPFLKTADSLALCAEWNNINKSFLNYFDHRCKFPRFKCNTDKASYVTSLVNKNIRINADKIRLPKIGMVKITFHRNFPLNAVIKRCIVRSDKIGKYYVSIVLCIEINEIVPAKIYKVMGLDFKVGDVFVDSDGNMPQYTKPYRKANAKLKYLEKKLGRKRKFSKNWYRSLRKIQKLHKAIAFKRKDFLHKLSKTLSKMCDAVVIETLSLSDIAFELVKGGNTYDTSYYRFTRMLKYKLQEIGKKLINVDKWFPSSKMCSKCGHVKTKLALSERVYNCEKCGLVIDRDTNAAINIREEGKKILNTYKYTTV